MPACGALIMAITDPPSLEGSTRIFGDVQALEERLGSDLRDVRLL
jgi:hypothetical protein